MKLTFQNRIALFNTLAAAAATLLVFLIVYAVVFFTAYHHLNQDILQEKEEIFSNLLWKGDSIVINQMPEWEEQEHQQVEVNPTFIQITDSQGNLRFRSANLQEDFFLFIPDMERSSFLNSRLNGQRIRLGYFPIFNSSGTNTGQLALGVSMEESAVVLNNLRITLLLAFPLLLLVLYLATSFAASKGIAPVHQIIETASGIDDANAHTRLPMPEHKDEIHQLAATINALLNRIESRIKREKQFTADASHELRTPLAAIRGTLEVLARRQREPAHYEEKITEVIREVDRMNQILNQLLQLSRLEAGNTGFVQEPLNLKSLADELLPQWQAALDRKRVSLQVDIPPDAEPLADRSSLSLMLDNLVGNAIKYCPSGGKINISWRQAGHTLTVADDGPGIAAEHLPHLFERFYRADASRTSQIPGTGLGLSIVKKLAELQGISLELNSREEEGTTFILRFPPF
ncbi:MAG: HAMP domain-containing histidine kinase [Lewinellaceae bacterium]|nr:HAMP domain-containing histidine kinase [Lewinellaceae bacterium]